MNNTTTLYQSLKYITLFIILFVIYIFTFAGRIKADTLTYLHQDHLGSTTLATSDKGQVISQQVYYPYGTTRAKNGSQATERQYTGQVSDTDQTGLYYYNARYYNPQIAKFTQADTTSDQMNRYAYVSNNPISYVDPTGNKLDPFGDDGGASSTFPYNLGTSDIPLPTGLTGGNTRTTWTGSMEEYPFTENMSGDPNDFYQFLSTTLAGSASLPIVVSLCGGNPACIVEVYDLLFDSASCITGDQVACANISNPIPGATRFGEVTVKISTADTYAENGHFLKMRVDQWIAAARNTNPSNDLEFINTLKTIIYNEVKYDAPKTNLIRALSEKFPSLNAKTLNLYALCKFGVCSQKAQFMYAALRRAGFDPDLFLIRFSTDDAHLVVRQFLGRDVLFIDPTWDFIGHTATEAKKIWERYAPINYTRILE